MNDLVIFGAGGHGREILDAVRAVNHVSPRYRFLGFIDDGNVDRELLDRQGAAYLGDRFVLLRLRVHYLLGIGSSATRRRLDAMIGDAAEPDTLVHPTAQVGSHVRMAPGVLLAVGAVVTTNVTVGRHSHLNVKAVVSHDCRIGDFVTISPGALINGNVDIEDDALIGAGAIVLPGCRIGRGAVVGAGAVVIDDIPPEATVVGVPARSIHVRRRDEDSFASASTY
ncbi:MAG: NeuD/PglB/VioB family sugar acetyltransferase [Gemmataceae bacterium]|nr:NeuD/PglB/VioB family sugar acetyltransferase [Gemmataceae bacterium]